MTRHGKMRVVSSVIVTLLLAGHAVSAQTPAGPTGPSAQTAKVEPGTYVGPYWENVMTVVVRVQGGQVFGTSHATLRNGAQTPDEQFTAPIGQTGEFKWANHYGSTVQLAPCPVGLCGMLDSVPYRARVALSLAKQP